MRIATEAEVDAMHQAVYKGAIKGFAWSAGVGLLVTMALQKKSTAYQSLNLPFKVALLTLPIVGGVTIGAEEALLAHEREGHKDFDGFQQQDVKKVKPQVPWRTLLADYRYHLVAGSWLAGVTASVALSYSNPLLTATQKAFHARVHSQAITVIALLATAAVAPFASKKTNDNEELFQRRLAYEEKKYKEEHPDAKLR
eukprot:comp12828_c0_seq1/m.7989 comp12828_c0_seq1/g.7989  ORF comp12828_c0_seq1/g.7989 comp12828_c0_seq1/m.7989 type:complete len:198 (-) comp12828_c0_seq1:281-874(-)